MDNSTGGLALRSFALGLVSGSRSAVGFAAATFIAEKHTDTLADTPLRPLTTAPARLLAVAGALGESLLIDKLAITPSRITPGPLGGRIAIGALAGAGLCLAHKQAPITGALLGAAGAFIGSHLGYNYRVKAAEVLKVPDLPLALAEDAAAVTGAYLLVKAS